MFICNLITVLKLASLIEISHSFKPPKHNIISYYKTVNNVYLTDPENHKTSYGIYVAGQTTTLDIPSNVSSVYDIVNWKVINLNKDRLMFVYNKKAQILIDQKTIKEMKFSGELSDSIIAFGDNEALHVPTISNPDLTKPNRAWNYIELLYFDVESESVSVIRRLPWLKDDDWKFIKEWKMADYIHFDDKLYLLIERSIWNRKERNVIHEISLMRLCLDKGSELISSAVEILINLSAFFPKDRLAGVAFDFWSPNGNSILNSISAPFNFKPSLIVALGNETIGQHILIFYLEDTFVHVGSNVMCASSCKSSEFNLLRYHLRSESSVHKKSTYEPCSSSMDLSPYSQFKPEYKGLYKNVPIYQTVRFAHPFNMILYIDFQDPRFLFKSSFDFQSINYCPFHYCYFMKTLNQKWKGLSLYVQQKFFVNQSPFGGFMITKANHEIMFFNFYFICLEFTNCLDCIMYGLHFNCVWSTASPTDSKCIYDNRLKHRTALTINHCFKIMHFSPSMFNLSEQETLSIELDRPLVMDKSKESLVIQAGPDNYCTNTIIDGLFIECYMNPFKPGKFNIEINLMNDKIADVAMISAVSIETVHINVPKMVHIDSKSGHGNSSALIIVLFSCILLCLCVFIAYTRCNRERLTRIREFGRSKRGHIYSIVQTFRRT